MDWWLGCPVQRTDRNSPRHNHVRFSPSLVQPRVPIQVLALRSPVINFGNTAVRFALITVQEGES